MKLHKVYVKGNQRIVRPNQAVRVVQWASEGPNRAERVVHT